MFGAIMDGYKYEIWVYNPNKLLAQVIGHHNMLEQFSLYATEYEELGIIDITHVDNSCMDYMKDFLDDMDINIDDEDLNDMYNSVPEEYLVNNDDNDSE